MLGTLCQRQICSLWEQKLGGGRNQEGHVPLSQADGTLRRLSQIPLPSCPLPSSPHSTPLLHCPPLHLQQLWKGQPLRKALIVF